MGKEEECKKKRKESDQNQESVADTEIDQGDSIEKSMNCMSEFPFIVRL